MLYPYLSSYLVNGALVVHSRLCVEGIRCCGHVQDTSGEEYEPEPVITRTAVALSGGNLSTSGN